MTLAFNTVRFYISDAPMKQPWTGKEVFNFQYPIQSDFKNNRPIVSVTLKSFELHYSQPAEWPFSKEQVQLDIDTEGGDENSGTVIAQVQVTPGFPGADSRFGGYVEALVIAEIVEPKKIVDPEK